MTAVKRGSNHIGHVIITIGTGDQTPGKIESEAESAKRERKEWKGQLFNCKRMGKMKFK